SGARFRLLTSPPSAKSPRKMSGDPPFREQLQPPDLTLMVPAPVVEYTKAGVPPVLEPELLPVPVPVPVLVPPVLEPREVPPLVLPPVVPPPVELPVVPPPVEVPVVPAPAVPVP